MYAGELGKFVSEVRKLQFGREKEYLINNKLNFFLPD